jgi:hypothetical protein
VTVSPRLTSAGLVLLDPGSGNVQRIIAMQYAPHRLQRTLEVQPVADQPGRSQALRIRGPAVETFSIEAVLDASDRMERPGESAVEVRTGIFPDLAALELLVQPTTAQLERQNRSALAGMFEIAPVETPLVLFVWSARRIVPVRVTSLSITEEAFDSELIPIRATVSLGLRTLSVDDLGFGHRGGSLYMAYLKGREALAATAHQPHLDVLGIRGLP